MPTLAYISIFLLGFEILAGAGLLFTNHTTEQEHLRRTLANLILLGCYLLIVDLLIIYFLTQAEAIEVRHVVL